MALLNKARPEGLGANATAYGAAELSRIDWRTGSNLVDAACVAVATALATGSIAWMFFGSGYALLSPGAYRVTTSSLLAHPLTAARAKSLLAEKGYLSAFDTNGLQSDAASPPS